MFKKLTSIILAAMVSMSLTSCGNKSVEQPDLGQMRAICDLAVMDCYYHNVAKFFQEDASGILFWKKDKNFWLEYDGVVTLGIDASKISMKVKGQDITVTLPPAEVQECKVDSDSLTVDSYIIYDNSAKISADDEILAIKTAQDELEKTAKEDTGLLMQAQQQAKALIEDYIVNIGKVTGVTYNIEWEYLDNTSQDETAES